MSLPNEKKSPWIGRDANGRLCLFRKLPKHYNYYKLYKYEKEVVEVCEQEEYEYAYDSDSTDLTDVPRHRACNSKHKKEDHHAREHHRHDDRLDKPSPKAPALPKPILKKVSEKPEIIPIVALPPKVEVRRPRHRSPSPTAPMCLPCSPTFRLREFWGHSPPAPKKPSPSPRSPKIYRVVDPHLKLERIPVHKLYKTGGHVHPARLKKVKLERVRPEDIDELDLDKLNLRPNHHEWDRHRARCDNYEHEDSDVDGEEIRGRAGNPSASVQRRQSYSRNRVVEEERAQWDEDLEAFVVKRVPGVRFE